MSKRRVEAGRTINETLRKLGYRAFRNRQEEAIRYLLQGRDVLVVLPTGSGKSLIYQIAALHKPGLTLVISPLIALMQDQIEKLQAQGVPATFINSSLSEEQEAERLECMVDNAYKIVYVAPERLRQCLFHERIRELDISLLAVDEAHSISQWGHDFRPDYLHIAEFRRFLNKPVTVALTATATHRVKEEIVENLELNNVKRVYDSFDRPNIKFSVRRIRAEDKADEVKPQLLRDIFSERPDTVAIVYVGTRKDAETVAAFLHDDIGLEARYYHGGMSAGKRAEVEEAFLSGDLPVVVATNAFGMGIDRSDVRLLVHHRIPGSIEAYYQEAGRAGRDGQPAEAILLYSHDDHKLHEFFIERSDLTYQTLQTLYRRLREMEEEQAAGETELEVDVQELGRHTRLHGSVSAGLQRLEEAEVIEQGLYEGNKEDIRLLDWNEDRVQAVAEEMKAHRQRQMLQLAEIVEYAENELQCRRTVLLEHFEDDAPEEVRRGCCDICEQKLEVADFVADIEEESTAPEEQEVEPEPPPLTTTILDCVRTFDGLRTVEQLVDLLHGDERGYNKFRDSDFHGRLSGYDATQLRAEIEQLIEDRTLVVTDVETVTVHAGP